MKKIGKLHVLTDTVLQGRFSHLELARMAIRGGADTIQYRQKSGSTREMIRVAAQMKQVCSDQGVPLIVNDRVDIAIAVKADGVHLGQDDFPIPLARELLGQEMIIGASASNMEEVKKCLLEGADYVGFGPIYPTTSKDDAGSAKGIDGLAQVVKSVPVPIIAIGGIGLENVSEILRTGVHGIAVISSVCCREDPEQAAKALYQILQGGV
ncbi:MAG: thiamine phosphate synthase [Deltaproteobacteria bacterium]|nr:thiamine phosphate synthase [Deltaproteobacteria bacterium]